LTGILGEVAEAEGISIDEKSLVALAREAEGSVRDAQSFLDQVISYAGQDVTYEDVRDVLGVVDRGLLIAVARAVVERDPRGVVEHLAEAERYGYDVRRFAYDLLDVFRDLAVLKAIDQGADLVDLAPEEVAEAHGFVDAVPWEDVHALFDILNRGLEGFRIAARPGSVLEMTLLKMAKLPPVLALSEITDRVRRGAGQPIGPSRPAAERPAARTASPAERHPGHVGKKVADRPTRRVSPEDPEERPGETGPSPALAVMDEPAKTETAGAPERPRPTITDSGEVWRELLAQAEETNRPFWNVLKAHGSLTSWDPEQRVATVTCDDPGHEFFLQSKLSVLTAILRRVAGDGARVELKCDRAQTKPAAPRESDRARHVKREALEHPLVREAIEIFDGNVEEVRVHKP
jgi:DNA polymerase-3 subunit gamma/tau